jgi:hypothetical protein
MQEDYKDINKLFNLQNLIEESLAKGQALVQSNDSNKQDILDLIEMLSDATTKMIGIQWSGGPGIFNLRNLIGKSLAKGQALVQSNDSNKQDILDLIEILSDATTKMINVQWSDDPGMGHGFEMYRIAIRNK